jgi:hypothetical protein
VAARGGCWPRRAPRSITRRSPRSRQTSAQPTSASDENADSDFRCLPTILSDRGYHTYALQGIRPDFWNLATIYPRIGYERFLSRRDFIEDEIHGHGLTDAKTERERRAGCARVSGTRGSRAGRAC